jgi:outer membrane protein OmpA-like peptidoglycan-associated protein
LKTIACGMLVLALGMGSAVGAAPALPEVPFRAGVSFVLAVSSPPDQVVKGAGVIAGDYEMVVSLDAAGDAGLTQTAFYDGTDETGRHRRGKVRRTVSAEDVATGGVQVQGFHSSDPPALPGTTSLGPSLAFMRELAKTGRARYAFRMFAFNDVIRGELRRVGSVRFPVIINRRRVELDAIRLEGQLELAGVRAPYEMIVLDHPRHPLSLRIAYGPRGAGFPFEPRFAREIVRVNFAEEERALEKTLERDCRVEVPGIHFDFNLDTIQPQSLPALREIAAALRAMPTRRVVVEGHTDDVGTEAYNDDLSSRRARSVRRALEDEPGVDVRFIDTRGFGERRPLESNLTLAGRARNRRVEIACAP